MQGSFSFHQLGLWARGSLSGKFTSVVIKGTIRAPEGPREDFHVAKYPLKITVPETPLMAKPSVRLNVACFSFLFKPEMPLGVEDMKWKPPINITVVSVGLSVTLLWDLRERLQS